MNNNALRHSTGEQHVFWRYSNPVATLKRLEVSVYPRAGFRDVLQPHACMQQQQQQHQQQHQQPLEGSLCKGGRPCTQVAAAHPPMAFSRAAETHMSVFPTTSSSNGRQAPWPNSCMAEAAHAIPGWAQHTVSWASQQSQQPWKPGARCTNLCGHSPTGQSWQQRQSTTPSQLQQRQRQQQQRARALADDIVNAVWVHDSAQLPVAEQCPQQPPATTRAAAAQVPAGAAASDALPHGPRTLHQLLVFFQQQQQQQQRQWCLSPSERALAANRLERKLTNVITSSCLSAADVADVLLAAESCGRLNCTHVAAALARLARLAAADNAATAAASSGSSSSSSRIVVAQVPLQPQQWGQMQIVRQAAAAALIAAPEGSSRWHILPLTVQRRRPLQVDPDDPASLLCAGQGGGHGDGDQECHHQQQDNECGPDPGGALEVQWQQEQEQHLLDQLIIAVEAYWPIMPAAALTSCCWSLAVLGQVLPETLLPQVGGTVLLMAEHLSPEGQGAAARQEHQTTSFSSSSSSSGGSGCSGPGAPFPDVCEGAQQPTWAASPRQLVLLLWSLARMQVDPHDLLQHPAANSTASSSRDTCSILWGVLQHMQPHISDLSAQSLVLLLWALSSFRSPVPAPAATGLLEAAAKCMSEQVFIPHALSVTLWAAARLQLPTDAGWLASWLVSMRAALPACNGHDVSMSVWALATLGVAPPSDWLLAVSIRAGHQAHQLSPAELPVLLWSLGRLRYRPPLSAALELLEQGGRLAAAGQLSPQGLALLVWSCGRLGLPVRAAWLDDVLEAAGCYLPLFGPVEASGLLVGLVRLQHIPDQAWMEAWWAETAAGLLPASGGQQLVLLLWGAVQLGQRPPGDWWRVWQQCSAGAMAAGSITAKGYGMIWQALTQLEQAPHPSWLKLFWKCSSQPAVLQAIDCLAAERILVGLAAAAASEADGGGTCGVTDVPGGWSAAFFAATLPLMPESNLMNLAGLLEAAGQLGLAAPQAWVEAAMTQLALLATRAGILPSSRASAGSTSSTGSRTSTDAKHHNFVLSARLQRRHWRICLSQVLSGLRLQHLQMGAGRGSSRHGRAVVADSSDREGAAPRGVVMERWPWLELAVHATWPDKQSAEQALRILP